MIWLSALFIFSNSGQAADPCPHFKINPGQNTRAYQSLEVPDSCTIPQLFACANGVLITSSSQPVGGKKIVGVSCYRENDPELTKLQSSPRSLTPGDAGAVGPRLTGPLSSADQAALRKEALAQGVPAVVYDRAFANYQTLMGQGKTSRSCFMAADLTAPGKGQSWKICAKPQAKIVKSETFVGIGTGENCKEQPYRNELGQCSRFFGNKAGYCLSAGGRYLTGEGIQDSKTLRPFIPLIGFDKNENDNSTARNVGVRPAMGAKGLLPDPAKYSQGNFTVPSGAGDLSAVELSASAEGGGMALYVYPSRQDILDYRKNGHTDYWNVTCATKIGLPGWVGEKDFAVDKVTGNKKSEKPASVKVEGSI